jgi:hypothetical protein
VQLFIGQITRFALAASLKIFNAECYSVMVSRRGSRVQMVSTITELREGERE